MKFGFWRRSLLLTGAIAIAGTAMASNDLFGDGIVVVPTYQPAPVGGATVAEESAFGADEWESPEQMYEVVCSKCHDGSTPTTRVLLGRGISAQRVVTMVRNGGRAMPAFKPSDFNDAELAALAQWIEQSAAPTTGGQP